MCFFILSAMLSARGRAYLHETEGVTIYMGKCL